MRPNHRLVPCISGNPAYGGSHPTCHKARGANLPVSRLTETDRNGPKRTGTNRNGPERTHENTETDFYGYRNGLQWVPKRTGTDFSSYRNELQWEPEKVGWGTIGTILIKLCMYW